MARVWSYWKCNSCDKIIRGDVRVCPNCGAPIPNGVHYLMPDNPLVQDAMRNGTILLSANATTDSNGNINEDVPLDMYRDGANWECSYCGYQNYASDSSCVGCGMGKEVSPRDYFGRKVVMNKKDRKDYNRRTSLIYEEEFETPVEEAENDEVKEEVTEKEVIEEEHHINFPIANLLNSVKKETKPKKKFDWKSYWKNIQNFIYWNSDTIKYFLIGIGAISLIIFLFWLFLPITRTAVVQDFSWRRSINVDKYTECHESDWDLPSGAKLEYTREEIHHYNKVLDHYETKTRTYTERVLDHYETHYRDLGNGQCESYETPVYRTETRTETYDEPVYREEPEYRTKYYYEIGRWKFAYSFDSNGYDKNPYWADTKNIPSSVTNPKYGDVKLSDRTERYYAVIRDYKGNIQKVAYTYTEWMNLIVGDIITYKTFRFSDKPISTLFE